MKPLGQAVKLAQEEKMKKRNIIVAASALAALLLVVGAVSAFMGIGRGAKGDFGQHHETMEKIMEEGKYSDLVEIVYSYVPCRPTVKN